MDLVLPQLLDFYSLEDYISEGTYGEVYQVLDRSGQLLAAKISLSPYENSSLLEEAKVLAELRQLPDSPFLKYWGLFGYFHQVALVMEYFPGKSLRSSRPVTNQNIWLLVEELICQVEYLHYHGLVHGDINPSNILYSPETSQVVLIDFGGSYQQSSSRLRLGLSATSWSYAQKLSRLELGRVKDLFDLGLVFRWLLLGNQWNSLLFLDEPDLTITFPSSPTLENLVNTLVNPDLQRRSTANQLCRLIQESR